MIMNSLRCYLPKTVHDHETVSPVHEVLRVLGERVSQRSLPGAREDRLRVALAIEGGAMRGTISAGRKGCAAGPNPLMPAPSSAAPACCAAARWPTSGR
jgi:hypothetical protein